MSYFDELYAGFLGRFSPIWGEVYQQEHEIIDVEYEDISDQIQQTSDSASIPCAELIFQSSSQPKSPTNMERDIFQSQMGIRFNVPNTILKINI